MRPPLWILNSALLVLLIAALFFVIFSRQELPEWEDINPSSYNKGIQKKAPEINISKIYEHDLFDTYQKEAIIPTELSDVVISFPEPPTPRTVQIPPVQKPHFVEPLSISLKGIIFVHNDDSKNRIIVADTKTKHEALYKVGDTIDDAQLIKIFNQKAIFLRSNGQQEVIYLRSKDAQRDPTYAVIGDWKDVVHKVGDYAYKISPREFTKRIKSLAQFIDLFELTTVYQQGASIGCRVGLVEPDSLAQELGFMRLDIITSIDGIAVTNAQDRFKIYKQIIELKTNATITVKLLRNKQEMALQFILDDFKTHQQGTAAQQQQPTPQEPTHEQLKSLEERHMFAPTVQDIRERERLNMSKLSRRNLTSKFTE